MKVARSAAAALVTLVLAAPAAAEVRYASFASPSLGRDVEYAVQLPPSYGSGGGTYPVLYALHGLFESHTFWERRGLAAIVDRLWAEHALPEFLVVAVDGGRSFFVNGPEGKFEDLVTRDSIAQVEATYRVRRGREGRALIGVSMGGYGALRIAFKHPELFRAVATHSAMLLEQIPTAADGAGQWQMRAFHAAFGSPIDPVLWAASDPLALAREADPKRVPAVYFDCGSEDRFGLFDGNRELDRRLRARGVAHEFALHPGDHGYEYVRSVLERSLRFVAGAFGETEAAAAR
jgi:putative tributyrin esterase